LRVEITAIEYHYVLDRCYFEGCDVFARSLMESQDTWQEWLFVASYLGLLAFVVWGVLIRK
jgi:hypothetical protein